MGEFDYLFYKFEKLDTYGNDMLPPVQAYFRGENCIPGAHIYLPYRAYMKSGFIDNEPHFHRDEEYLAFVGHDLRNAFDSFDAEIEFWLGESRDDMEKIVITSPTMIRVPNFYWHGPIEIKRLGKPLFFQPVLFNCRYHAVKHRVNPDGKEYFETIAEGITPCKLNPNAGCTFCGKCHGKDMVKTNV